MMPRLLLAFSLAVLGVSGARLEPSFQVQGLEQLTARYGTPYPGFENVGIQQGMIGQQQPVFGLGQQQFGVGQYGNGQQYGLGQQFGVGEQIQPMMIGQQQQLQPALNLAQIPQVQHTVGMNLGAVGTDIGGYGLQTQTMATNLANINTMTNLANINQALAGGAGIGADLSQMQISGPVMPQTTLGSSLTTVMPAYGAEQGVPTLGAAGVGFGGVGAFGAGGEQTGGQPGLGTSKKTTMAAPIYAQAMVVPKIITQPILRPHAITQPILQQQLIQQPIVETRRVIQPVIRRIITQPIIRPEVYESTTIQPTLKTETTVQPHIVQQTVVTPTLQNQFEEQAPIQEKARSHVQQPIVQPVMSSKKNRGGALGYGGVF